MTLPPVTHPGSSQGALPSVSVSLPQPDRPGMPPARQAPARQGPGATLELGKPDKPGKPGEPCRMCQNRSYKDQSGDGNVSFKGGGKVAPGAAAAAIFSHEREHVANAHEKARQTGANVQTTVQIHTAICPSCKKVYVSGGSTRILFTGGGETPNPQQTAGRRFDATA
ncbi:MAG: hypothetical protein FWG72_05345 [Oscillospiraceae bacterium]|nr:hypothetical protein [Oscillospiraceae bacterium]